MFQGRVLMEQVFAAIDKIRESVPKDHQDLMVIAVHGSLFTPFLLRKFQETRKYSKCQYIIGYELDTIVYHFDYGNNFDPKLLIRIKNDES